MGLSQIGSALHNARAGIVIMAATYIVSIAVGMILVHAGNDAALQYRDSLVSRAHRSDPTMLANDRGSYAVAAALDFSRNLGLAAIPETIGGFTLVLPVALGAYRGWVGGIVSVDGKHRSRLRHADAAAAYYAIVMLLQVAGFTLAGGGGIHLGWANIRGRGPFIGPRWFRVPRNALIDVAWIYTLIVPVFAAGSAIEFLWT